MTTPTPTRGPCSPWDPIWCCDLTSAAEIALTGTAIQGATEILYNLSGQQFGLCEFTVRPCRQDCNDGIWWGSYGGWTGSWWEWGSYWPQPALIGGAWYNLTCGSCSGTCSCTPLSVAMLPSPVASIVEVKLNGQVLAVSGTDGTNGYRVDNYRELVRLGGASWPVCQDMTLPDTEPDTWSVTVEVGETVPVAGRMAVGELACEIIKSCTGQPCAIPKNAVSISRQGVQLDFPVFADLLKNGLLGLRWSDTFVATYNPEGLRARPQVYDVDFQTNRRQTWP